MAQGVDVQIGRDRDRSTIRMSLLELAQVASLLARVKTAAW